MKQCCFKICSVVLVVCAICCLTAMVFIGPPEPELCALCGNGEGRPYHAPCVLECSTGILTELAIYDPEPTQAGELAPEQDLDRHFFQAACGGRIVRTVDRSPDLQRCTAYVPETGGRLDKRLFCRACRKLAARAGGPYVLVDLLDPGNITAYPIEAGGACRMRGYTVSVHRAEGRHQIEVTAKLF